MTTLDISALLVLDDDQDMLDIVEFNLKSTFIVNLSLYKSDDEFIEDLADGINIVVLDHKLIKRTGLDVIKIIKDKNKSNFVIGFSAIEDKDVLIDYINSDINRWVDKSKYGYLMKLRECIMQGVEYIEKAKEFQQYFQAKQEKYKA